MAVDDVSGRVLDYDSCVSVNATEGISRDSGHAFSEYPKHLSACVSLLTSLLI